MCQKLISIIVPIFNVEKYIKKCVESLMCQDYRAIEIILVDDGSPDNSGIIIDGLAKLDKRIRVIHQKNSGVSSARNTGLQAAKGEYIMFVDGDDWVEKKYVSYFMELIEESGCEIGMNKNNYYVSNPLSSENRYTVNAEKAMEWLYLGDLFVAVWNKIYKASLLRDNDIFFHKEIWFGEGMLFNIECLQYVNQIVIGEKSVYHQTFNPDSAMRSFDLESVYCGIRSLDLQKKIWKRSTKKLNDAWNYHRYCFNRTILDGLVRTDQVKQNEDVLFKCVRNIRRNLLIPLKLEKSLKQRLNWICYCISPMLMAKRNAWKYNKNIEKIKHV